jgi:uncharacterized membrane protein
MDFNKVLNRYEGLFGKLGLLLVIVFFLMVIAGFMSTATVGKVMTLVLVFLLLLASLISYVVSKALD